MTAAIQNGTLIRRHGLPANSKWMSTIADVLVIVVGVTCTFTVKLVGELPISEVIILLVLPALLIARGNRVFRPGLNRVFSLMALWLCGQVLTDIYRGTAANDWMRGDANIIFFAIDLVSLAVLLTKNERRKVLFIASFAVGSLLAARFQPSDAALQYPWKFGYSGGANLLAVLAATFFYYRRRYIMAGVLLAGIMGVNLIENYRGPVLDILVAIVLVMPVIPERVGRLRLLPRAGTAARVVVLAGLALVAGQTAAELVHFVTARGIIGEEAQEKNLEQSQSKFGILLGGRPEILVSSRAVWASPILGYGSWAKDYKYTEMLHDIQEENGLQVNDVESMEENSLGLIPGHSHIMGAWIWSGILGAVFWVYVFWLALKGIVKLSMLRPPLAPIYATMLIGLAWDILFSPFASTRRMTEALLIVVIFDLLESGPTAFGLWRNTRFRQWRRMPPRRVISEPQRA